MNEAVDGSAEVVLSDMMEMSMNRAIDIAVNEAVDGSAEVVLSDMIELAVKIAVSDAISEPAALYLQYGFTTVDEALYVLSGTREMASQDNTITDGNSVESLRSKHSSYCRESFKGRDGAGYFDFLSIYYNSYAVPASPYPGLPYFSKQTKQTKEWCLLLDKRPFSMPLDVSEDNWIERKMLMHTDTALNDGVPNYKRMSASQEEGRQALRSGASFSAACAEKWGMISRETMAAEWRQECTQEPGVDFEAFVTREEWSDTSAFTALHEGIADDDGHLPLSKPFEPWLYQEHSHTQSEDFRGSLVLSKEQRAEQLQKIRSLAKRLVRSSRADISEAEYFAYLARFTYFLDNSQRILNAASYPDDESQSLDTGCASSHPYREAILLAEALDICDAFPYEVGYKVAVERELDRVQGLTIGSHNEQAVIVDDFDWKGQVFVPLSPHRWQQRKICTNPRRIDFSSESNRRHFEAFVGAHNENVFAFGALLSDPATAVHTKHPSWTKQHYAARLASDIMLKKALQLREVLEENVDEMRAELYTQHYLQPEATCPVNIASNRLECLYRDYEHRRLRGDWLKERLHSQLVNQLVHSTRQIDLVNGRRKKKLVKHYSKSNLSLGKAMSAELSRAIRRHIYVKNHRGSRHPYDYGNWFHGKLRHFVGNIAALPQRGVPVTTCRSVISLRHALMYAFLQEGDRLRKSTLCSSQEYVSTVFIFNEETVRGGSDAAGDTTDEEGSSVDSITRGPHVIIGVHLNDTEKMERCIPLNSTLMRTAMRHAFFSPEMSLELRWGCKSGFNISSFEISETKISAVDYPIYEGGRDAYGQAQGLGKAIYRDGSVYEGLFYNDKRNTLTSHRDHKLTDTAGTMVFPNKSKYIGEWFDDLPHGFGRMYNARGDIVYSGEWNEGSPRTLEEGHYELESVESAWEDR